MKEEIKKNEIINISEKYQQNGKEKIPDEQYLIESEKEYTSTSYYEAPKENIIKKIFKGIGLGGLAVGGTGLYLVISILHIIFVWGTGLGMVYYGISLIIHGSIFWGLVVLFLGTPIAVAIAQFLFPFWIILLIIGLIIGLIRWIF